MLVIIVIQFYELRVHLLVPNDIIFNAHNTAGLVQFRCLQS